MLHGIVFHIYKYISPHSWYLGFPSSLATMAMNFCGMQSRTSTYFICIYQLPSCPRAVKLVLPANETEMKLVSVLFLMPPVVHTCCMPHVQSNLSQRHLLTLRIWNDNVTLLSKYLPILCPPDRMHINEQKSFKDVWHELVSVVKVHWKKCIRNRTLNNVKNSNLLYH